MSKPAKLKTVASREKMSTNIAYNSYLREYKLILRETLVQTLFKWYSPAMEKIKIAIVTAFIVLVFSIISFLLVANLSLVSTQNTPSKIFSQSQSTSNSDIIYFLRNRLKALEDIKAGLDISQIEALDIINEEISIIDERIVSLYNAIANDNNSGGSTFQVHELSLYLSIMVLSLGLLTIGGFEFWKFRINKRDNNKN